MTNQILKIAERVIEKLVRQQMEIDEMHCGVMLVCGTISTTFVLRQVQERYLAKKRNMYSAVADLGKAFDWVPRFCMVGFKKTSCRIVVC